MQDDSKSNTDNKDLVLTEVSEMELYTDDQIREARAKLWEMGILNWKLDTTQSEIYGFYKDKKDKVIVINASRRLGKCIAEGSEVMTPTGPVPIEDLKIGDVVYGYNEDGSISPTKVINHIYNGEKEVYKFYNNTNLMAECTLDHVWLFNNTRTNKLEEVKIGKMKHGSKIVRKFVQTPGGSVHYKEAYALAALLGDGCSRQKYNSIHISSESYHIPKKVSECLNLNYRHSNSENFTWYIGDKVHIKEARNSVPQFELYDKWCRGRYAHEKIADIEVIKTWNRESRLAFLAGLIDTDGSVTVAKDGCLKISFFSQSESLVKAFQYLYYSLFQFKPSYTKENRNKYKNGPMFYCNIKNNLYNKKALKELDEYLVLDRKKWKSEYESLNVNNSREDYVGVKRGDSSIKKTYDITVDNKTHLFLMANGLVTHNSYTLLILAFEYAMQNPKSIIKFIQPEVKMIKDNIRPTIDEILIDCPLELQPDYKTHDNTYFFKNGSRLQLAGTDNGNYMKLRGSNCHLALIDEAGFCTDLKHIINYILIPTTTLTKGRIILASTTPPDPAHDFVTTYMQQAEQKGTFIKRTILDAIENSKYEPAPRFTPDILNEIVQSLELEGGAESDSFRTEYLCQLIHNSDMAVVPEFTPELEKEIVMPWRTPPFCDRYVSMDIGFQDMTAILFGYYDFMNGVLVIQDEIVLKGKEVTADKVNILIRQKEDQLWTSPVTGEFQAPYKRVSDNNLIFLNDLAITHNLVFTPTDKHQKDAYINKMRTMISSNRIIIDPKCVVTVSHLKNATWDKTRKTFKRSSDSGHFDTIDALAYMVRNLDENKNPYPANFRFSGLGSSDNVFYKDSYYGSNNSNGFDKIADQRKPKSSFSMGNKNNKEDEALFSYFKKKDKK